MIDTMSVKQTVISFDKLIDYKKIILTILVDSELAKPTVLTSDDKMIDKLID